MKPKFKVGDIVLWREAKVKAKIVYLDFIRNQYRMIVLQHWKNAWVGTEALWGFDIDSYIRLHNINYNQYWAKLNS